MLQPHSNKPAFFYFMAFIAFCSFCLLNLYIGVVFYQFSRIRLLAQTGSAFMTPDQQQWTELAKMVFRLKPKEKPPRFKWRLCRLARYVVDHRFFEWFITTVIIINVCIMATGYYGEPESQLKVKENINMVRKVQKSI